MKDYTLEMESVERRYPDFSLGPVDVAFGAGVTVILGPSGSGKSTLLKIIAGFESFEGSVRMGGRPLDGLPPEKRGVGLVFQRYALFPHLDVRENIAYGAGDPDRVLETAELLEIENLLSREVGGLSGGEQQRVALARALCCDPEALLLDEPLSSLDAQIRRRLRHDLKELLGDLDVPVIYVTHDQEEAMVVGDRIAVMGGGRIHQVGKPGEVMRRPRDRFVASFMGAENVFSGEVVESGEDGLEVSWRGGVVEAETSGFAVGEDVEFCVRPEDIMIIREGKPLRDNIRENMLRGTVVDRVDRGGVHSIGVSLECGPRVRIDVPDHAYRRLSMDTREGVTVSFKRDKVHVMRG
ncbi:MAG: Trehalose/maltose import ATP-binding protein MalK [Methanonatronarchaeales archaeon]|nr:Trehalose/maltose import ATP-binding protein MalK [Methanonatronarchaeales archaeon]